jgi:methionine-rich copper-binding protein CopC
VETNVSSEESGMRYPLFVALILALSVAASAQAHPKTIKTKPAHQQKQGKKQVALPKEPKAQQDSAAAQLRRTEQSSAKMAGPKKGQPKAGKAGVVKMQHEKANPPIRFNGGKGGGAGLNAKGGDQLKGRLKQKGGKHH